MLTLPVITFDKCPRDLDSCFPSGAQENMAIGRRNTLARKVLNFPEESITFA